MRQFLQSLLNRVQHHVTFSRVLFVELVGLCDATSHGCSCSKHRTTMSQTCASKKVLNMLNFII